MKIDLTEVIQAIIGLLAALITGFVIPWIKSKTTERQQSIMRTACEFAVAAAEQLYKGSGKGAEKLAYVKDYLRSHGYDVDETVIEGMVYELINANKPNADDDTVATDTESEPQLDTDEISDQGIDQGEVENV